MILFGIESKAIEAASHIHFEDRLDNGAAFARADHFSRSLRSGKESERIHDDGFPGACFARQEIETFFEVKFELIDESKISNAKKPQHTRAL